jgi:hypothetical protein
MYAVTFCALLAAQMANATVKASVSRSIPCDLVEGGWAQNNEQSSHSDSNYAANVTCTEKVQRSSSKERERGGGKEETNWRNRFQALSLLFGPHRETRNYPVLSENPVLPENPRKKKKRQMIFANKKKDLLFSRSLHLITLWLLEKRREEKEKRRKLPRKKHYCICPSSSSLLGLSVPYSISYLHTKKDR